MYSQPSELGNGPMKSIPQTSKYQSGDSKSVAL
jgi:hypothetical protein